VGWLIVLGLLVVGASALLSDLRLHDTAATCAGLRAPDASKPERRPELVTIHHQQPGDVLRPAVPPSRPVPGRGRPRTQVERGSLGSGRPPTPFQPAAPSDRGAGSDLAPSQLSAAQWAALRQLADAPDAVVACWPVGRAIAQALVRRGLVHACSEGCGSPRPAVRPWMPPTPTSPCTPTTPSPPTRLPSRQPDRPRCLRISVAELSRPDRFALEPAATSRQGCFCERPERANQADLDSGTFVDHEGQADRDHRRGA
jgi:hypothetical protein